MQKNNDIDNAIYGSVHVQQYKTDVAFKSLVQGIEDNLYIIPDFQRVYRWTETQVEDLAVSLVKGMPIPPIYAYRNDENQLEILDGQQRLLSMYFYYIGKYKKSKRGGYIDLRKLNDKPFREQLEANWTLIDKTYQMTYYDVDENREQKIDITYSQLPSKVKRMIDYTTITVIEISIDNKDLKERYLYKIFSNLNAGGTKLTPQELRNGIYRCPFYEMLFKFNQESEIWKKLFKGVSTDSTDIENLLRLCALKHFVITEDDEFIIKQYKNKDKLLNDFSEDATKFTHEEIDEYRSSLQQFMALIEGKPTREITLLESLFVVMDKKNLMVTVTSGLCERIKKAELYKETIKQGNATKAAIETKLKVVYNEICKYAK